MSKAQKDDNGSMWKAIGILASMVVGGIATFYVTLLLLGKPQSGDEASTNGKISLVAAIAVSLGMAVAGWYLHKRKSRESSTKADV